MHGSTMRGRGLVVLGLAGVLLLAAPSGAQAQSAGREFGLGATCALGNLIYGPAKLLYASGGALIAGMAWAFSGGDREVAGPILDASVRGDYVIMPSHLQGRRELEFVGRRPDHERVRRDDPYEVGDGTGGLERGGPPDRPEPESLDEGF
ncbi:MAG: hypothetical protein R3263_03145 [Myxococcota bacterium]|nr:hypothetical protein [Myxococcota bacterium]